jgi:hypothetical protein
MARMALRLCRSAACQPSKGNQVSTGKIGATDLMENIFIFCNTVEEPYIVVADDNDEEDQADKYHYIVGVHGGVPLRLSNSNDFSRFQKLIYPDNKFLIS